MLPSLQTPNLMSTSLLLPFNGSYYPMVENILYFRNKNRIKMSYCFYKRNDKLLQKNNKTLCNFNVYYLPPLSNIFQVEQNNMIYFQPFFHCKNQSTRYFHIFHLYLQVTYTLLPHKNFSSYIQTRIIQRSDPQSSSLKDR